ncbi:MAG TPA: DUF748 domain-containing protein [Opitutus sp.]|nr:DUF748 domain-containing protein [Opitutus sp.]
MIGLGVIVTALVVVQLIASPLATWLVNRKLADVPGYSGTAGRVSIALWKAGIDVRDFTLFEGEHATDRPLLRVEKASIQLAPVALFSGKLGGSARVDGVELNVIKRQDTPEPSAEEIGQKMQETKEKVQRWQDILRASFPVKLTRLEVRNARFQFVDRTEMPPVDFGIHSLHILATELQNRPKANGDPLPARVEINGLVTGNGKLKVSLRLDPMAEQPRFALNFELRELSLPSINSFLLAYASADVSRGTFELYSEIDAQEGRYEGYVKPLFHDLDFKTASDENKGFAERLKEKVVSAVATVFENKAEEQVATNAPFAGNFANNELDIWTTIANLIRNAFVQAIRGGLEGQTPSRE